MRRCVDHDSVFAQRLNEVGWHRLTAGDCPLGIERGSGGSRGDGGAARLPRPHRPCPTARVTSSADRSPAEHPRPASWARVDAGSPRRHFNRTATLSRGGCPRAGRCRCPAGRTRRARTGGDSGVLEGAAARRGERGGRGGEGGRLQRRGEGRPTRGGARTEEVADCPLPPSPSGSLGGDCTVQKVVVAARGRGRAPRHSKHGQTTEAPPTRGPPAACDPLSPPNLIRPPLPQHLLA